MGVVGEERNKAGGVADNGKPPQRFAIVLVPPPEPADVPPTIRLRRALKCLLRSFGLRCVECRPADEQDDNPVSLSKEPVG